MTTAAIRVVAVPGATTIETERELNGPRDLVFRAWTDPALLAQWLGPRRLEMRVDAYEVRHGGAWRYVHIEADGTEYGFRGVFHGEPTPERIVQTFEFEGAPGHVALDTLILEDLGGRTLARTISSHQTVEARDAMLNNGMADGMEEGYVQLEELLARLTA